MATPEEIKIQQVFIRNEISNDQETAGIAVPKRRHYFRQDHFCRITPWVEDAGSGNEADGKGAGEHEDTDYGQTIGGAVDGEEE